jgi:preprotein translocase subunit SecF
MRYFNAIIVPTILLIAAIAILSLNYIKTGEWFARSIDLKGGLLITINVPSSVKVPDLSPYSATFREISSITGHAIQIQAPSDIDPNIILTALKEAGIDTTQSSVQIIGPALGYTFWIQAQWAIILALVFMGIVVFGIFKTGFPSFYVILCGASDLIVTLAIMQLFNIELSLASLAALLMLIGYSIDTDILLTSRVLKGEGPLTERIKSAFKTGITMTATALAALFAILVTGIASVLSQIATVLIIGLFVDICFTWLQNATLLRWWAEKKGGYNI